MAVRAWLVCAIGVVVLVDILSAQDFGESREALGACPAADTTTECPPRNLRNNECLIDKDCPEETRCCSDGCELKCAKLNKTVEKEVCAVPVDLGFLIDASGSIGAINFQKILQFVAKIVDAFDIQENGTHVGVIFYSDDAQVAFKFNKFKGEDLNKEAIITEINKIKVTEGQTRIDLALKLAKDELFSVENGMRPDKPKIALVMTDGRQTRGEDAPDAVDLHIASRPLKDLGVQVYSLGIGKNYDIGELLDIASDDASVFRSADVDELVSIVASITEQTCKGCTNPVDIHFAIDSSANVGEENFEMIKNFIKAVGYKFIISETGSHMSASVFGEEATVVFNMSKATSQDNFLLQADAIPYLGDGEGNMDKALRLAQNQIFTLDGFARQNAPKVLVLITASDCITCVESLEEAAKPLKMAGTHIITIPVGTGTKDSEMQKIASLPFNQYILPQQQFTQLLNGPFIQTVSQMICSGKPGLCVEPPIPKDCANIKFNCDVDVDCPSGRKCCLKDCEQTCAPPVTACIASLDLAFAFETTADSSGVISQVQSFSSDLIDHFKVGTSGTHVSISTFSDKPNRVSKFSTSYDAATIKSTVTAIKSDEGAVSNLGDFLQFAREEIFNIRNGVRKGQPRVLVIFTNGKVPQDQVTKARDVATQLKDGGDDVQIIVVNTGDATQREFFESIVSKPTGSKYISIQNAQEFKSENIKQQIAEEVCSAKTRRRECTAGYSPICSVRDNLCESDFDCPGLEECVSDGCRLRCAYCGKRCKDKLDFLFIMDDSAKVGRKDFERTKQFTKTLLEWFNLGQNGTNVAVMTYSDKAKVHMPFPLTGADYPPQTLFDLQGSIDSIAYTGGTTSRLDIALRTAAAQVFPPNAIRRKAKKVILIFTDGNDDSKTRLDVASWPLRKQKITVNGNSSIDDIRIMAASIGAEMNVQRLENVVSAPLDENVFAAGGYDDLAREIREISTQSCIFTAGSIKPPIEVLPGEPGDPGPKGEKGPPGMSGMDGENGARGPKGDLGMKGAKGMTGDDGPPGPSGDGAGSIDSKGPDPLAGAVGTIEGEAKPGPGGIIYDLRKGPDGPPGPVGKVGSAGEPGDLGNKGRLGRVGPQGERGYFGNPGPKGDAGTDGKPGEPGEPGKQGQPGSQGPVGSQGIPGPQGPFGFKGTGGLAGSVGDVGDNGLIGAKGYAGEKGDQGDLGTVGFSGPEGPVGPPGPPGQRGLRGNDGIQGPAGKTGSGGAKGQLGPRGNRGAKGQTGSAGARGVKGGAGDTGPQGELGPVGALGPAGADGQPGIAGSDGPPGLPGPAGASGPIGPRGEIGAAGEVGPVGGSGLKGAPGEQGRRGLTGPKGENGDQGEPGVRGTQGQLGKQGKTGQSGPRGPPGAIGSQGLQGQPGDPGQRGQEGSKGNTGKFGGKGLLGDKGSRGFRGTTGPKGLLGEGGNVGRPGMPGRDGKNGQQGTNGNDGDPGAAGPQGLQGLPGPVGVPGTSGDSGDSGDSGKRGADGAKGMLGDAGARGTTGITGQPGQNGARGERGEQGPAGTPGNQGPSGPRGAPGLDGQEGAQGAKGSGGRPGNPGTVGEQGSPGGIGLPGAPGGPGPAGERGEVGSDGGPGEQGSPGLPGRQGLQGPTGSDGRPGSPGSTGAKGALGLQGSKGQNGQDGNPGQRGPDGLSGARGLPGQRGVPGPNGSPGLDGNAGPAGEVGKVGKSGVPGLPGPAGLRGSSGPPGPRGDKGPQGSRGDLGEVGQPGTFGEVGQAGTRGETGPRGPIGEVGNSGEIGPQGMPGPQGPSGPAGADGPLGPPGPAGKDGNKGPIGDPGNAGNPGRPGEQGVSGKDGLPGSAGNPGSQGKRGLSGPVGPQGPVGEQGMRGAPGNTGTTGLLGPKGFSGSNGASGLPGKKGPRGKEGPAGKQGPAGRNGRSGKNGLDGKDGEKGTVGPKGDAGERGDSGSPGGLGEAGETGNAGPGGETGPEGPRGPNGNSGAPGKRGERGETGEKGPNGASGLDGRKGSKGSKGKMGRYGMQGPAGDSGEKGDEGIDGPPGHSGPQGHTGEPGPDGDDGVSGPKGPTGNGGQIGNEGMTGAPGDSGSPGTAGTPGPPGPAGPPGDMSGALAGNFWDYISAGGGQKGPRYYRNKRSTDDLGRNDIEVIIKRHYEVFKNFDELWNNVLNDIVNKKKLGSRKNPAITCGEMFKTNPYAKTGDYWIDPNEGSHEDAILVHCNATNYETCIYARRPSLEKDHWYTGNDKLQWAFKDLLTEENGILYASGIVQLKMMRLLSATVRQNITFQCKNSKSDIQLLTDNNKQVDIRKAPKIITNVIKDNCQINDGKWRESVFELSSEKVENFPIQDVGLLGINGDEKEFGLQVGPVCFM